MAASTKTELLAVCRKEFDELTRLVEQVDSDTALAKGPDDTSIKDVVGHRANWITLFLGWYTDGLAGRDVYFPAEGYKWNELRRYNAELRSHQASVGWQEARSALQQAYNELTEFINTTSEADIYGGPMKGAKNTWTWGRWAEAAGPSH